MASEAKPEPVTYVIRCHTCGGFEGAATLKNGYVYRLWEATRRQIEEATVDVSREAELWCRCGLKGKR